MGLSHLDEKGAARMVDVGDKPITQRRAVAQARVELSPATLKLIAQDGLPKGDALAVARLAGIMAAKKTPELIPLCHPLPLTAVSLELTPQADGVLIEATTSTNASTGVEMEAMTAASVAALALYDMVKGVDRGARVGQVQLMLKEGGKSGLWRRED
ncbi:MAG: cyclic pyranopterin monophosphate synthase MoaC [Desulfarculaceae bacterium]|nr:cyclic pyranopterin monophosphate synthase MoaC [Desulfarculaceae bacterium]MCF8071396.1 cyclic pyranopterin monophosphate synthase MoaC [Desulfarculaceae bacterium]MCF8101721.1 cyclic pyranopterin monophosphate synthase MoaC [Desulfarculaceae bacterium]MCF8118187.1 cyclic pyranopterin monophosphate synthase MoaC [Desulfarculaceae bacterium]